MNKITFEFFQKFVKYGTGNLSISKRSILIRKRLILSCLQIIEDRLPQVLQGESNLDQLSNELAEVAIVIQAFAIRNFGLTPNPEFLAKENKSLQFENPHMEYGVLSSFGVGTNNLSRVIAKCVSIRKKKFESMHLQVDQVKLGIPSAIQSQLIDFIQKSLERLKREEGLKTALRKELSFSNFIHIVASNVSRYIQKAHLGYPSFNGKPSQNELMISSFVLMAAGYLPSPAEYEKRKTVKDYRNVLDREYLEATGQKRQVRKVRYQPHHIVLLDKVKALMKETKGFNIRLFNWMWH
ncbi:MAG: hypothetical protein JNJ75_04485 [Cyclobacteriaceae bacterium]|nr:hypothetical protein [Cyclobacteriaceae bacterium]